MRLSAQEKKVPAPLIRSQSDNSKVSERSLSTVEDVLEPGFSKPRAGSLPRVSLDTQGRFPRSMLQAWVPVAQRPFSPSLTERPSSSGSTVRPDSPSSTYSQDDPSSGSGAPQEAVRETAPASPTFSERFARSSMDTIRPLRVRPKSPANALAHFSAPSKASEKRHSFEIVTDFIGRADNARVVRDVVLQYTLPNLAQHAGNPAKQAAVAAERISELRSSEACASPYRGDIVSEGFLDAYQTVLQSLGNNAQATTGCVTSLSSEDEGNNISRSSSRASTRVGTFFSRPSTLVRSLSSMSFRPTFNRVSQTEPSSPVNERAEYLSGSDEEPEQPQRVRSTLRRMASAMDLSRVSRANLPRSASALSFTRSPSALSFTRPQR